MQEESNFHVHFSEDTDTVEHSKIIIKEDGLSNYKAHIGFLQINHRYLIDISIQQTKCVREYSIDGNTPSMWAKIISVKAGQEGDVKIEIEFFAHKEKLVKESFKIVGDDGSTLNLSVHARVLGKGKGTPMLKDGITCIGVEMEDESEASDWPGFE